MAEKKLEDTPMLKQYFSVKAQHPEALLLFRVGDFYETYSDDAVTASKVLGLVLTRRSNGSKGYTEMAGFPHHAVETYLQKLIRSGYKVAICDQLEDPALVKNKLVKRGITEILTPGVAFGEGMLEQKENNFLAGLVFDGVKCGAAFLDVSTGTFKVAQGSVDYIGNLVGSLSPREIVVRRDWVKFVEEKFRDIYVTPLEEWAFVYDSAVERLCRQFDVPTLKGFAVDSFPLAVCAAGALTAYLEQTRHAGLKNICSLSRIDEGKFMWMDKFTFRNLEVFASNAGKEGVSLVEVMDRCNSPMGSRMLRQWLAMPVLDLKEIESRYDTVQYFVDNPEALSSMEGHIRETGDLERIIARAATGKISPRELRSLKGSLEQMNPIAELCRASQVQAITSLASSMKNCDKLLARISSTLDANPAAAIGKGDVIAPGVDSRLDELREISRGGRDYLNRMQEREAEKTGIASLKIGYNNVFGYYIEVRNAQKDRVPEDWIRKQTLVNAERYITKELKEYEEQILNAESTIYEIESRLYGELVAEVQKYIRSIQTNCAIVSRIDVLAGFARIASQRNYCRPVMDKSLTLDIKDGRHPVIETLMKPGEEYVPNDIYLDSAKQQIIILTGPNMAGKSALLRQTALIVLMAQTGSFVPASSAHIGWFDKIFTRVGATDNISRGESTFMVEMLETSMIMHNLSKRSLVLLDEIGRGTSTYDGMSIARALVEYIHGHGQGAKTLFATHYHELNDLEQQYERVKNYHIATREQGKDVIFLRKLKEGGIAHSFGIHVARMAGMPAEVINSAEKTLKALEQNERNMKAAGSVEEDGSIQLSLFQLDDPTLSAIKNRLEEADLNNMTPLQAFDLLRQLKEEVGLN